MIVYKVLLKLLFISDGLVFTLCIMPLDYGVLNRHENTIGTKRIQTRRWFILHERDTRLQQSQVGTNHQDDVGLESLQDYERRE